MPIFGAVYSAESIFKFGIIDLGQVTFVFFVLVSVLERYRAGTKRFSETLLGFFTTPVILSILLGILANQTGVMSPLNARPISAAVLTMFVLPPPFIIQLFIKESDDQNRAYVVNTLSLSTLVTLFAFAIISVLYTPVSSGAGLIHLP
jgi:predicted permease